MCFKGYCVEKFAMSFHKFTDYLNECHSFNMSELDEVEIIDLDIYVNELLNTLKRIEVKEGKEENANN